MVLAIPGGPGLMAAIKEQFTATPPVITLSLSSDFGLPGTVLADLQPGIVADQIEPLDETLNNPAVTVDPTAGLVGADGTITKALATSYTNYIWRLRMTDADHDNFNTANLMDSYVFPSTGGNPGQMPRTTNPTTQRLKVEILRGTLDWYQGNSNRWFLYRKLNLKIDLRSIRYSGTYRETFTSTIAY